MVIRNSGLLYSFWCNLPKIRGLGKCYRGVHARGAYSSSIRSLMLSFV